MSTSRKADMCGKGQHGGDWNETNAAECKRLVLLGWSGGQIAAALRLTRNQIVGKVARMGLHLGGGVAVQPGARAQVRRVKERTQPKAPTATSIRVSSNGRRAYAVSMGEPPAASPVHHGPSVGLCDLKAHACRWPFGDGPYTFCGRPTSGVGPYCETCIEERKPYQRPTGFLSDRRLLGTGRKHARVSPPTFDDYERKAGWG